MKTQNNRMMKFEQLMVDRSPELTEDQAIEMALDDLLDALRLVNGSDRLDLRLQVVEGDGTVAPLPTETYALTIEKRAAGTVAVDLVAGDRRGVCYGIFELLRRIRFDHALPASQPRQVVQPDIAVRMITQPFEACGFSKLAEREKPIVRPRQLDAMKPFDAAGYSPLAEARNLLRAGYNTFWVGSWIYATEYDGYDPGLFPAGSEARTWLDERRARLRANIEAARAMHLNVCISGDVFTHPHGIPNADRYRILEYSLDAILTEYPEVDIVCTRYGENYAFQTPWFEGEEVLDDDETARVTNVIQEIVCKRHGRHYWCRTWTMGNESWHADPDHFRAIDRHVNEDSRFRFSTKNAQTDYWRYNRFNPCFGTTSKVQVIEWLCQDSFHFRVGVPYYEGLRMSRGPVECDGGGGLALARERGVDGAWGWLTADGWNGPYLKREEWFKANIYAFARLCTNVHADPDELAREWAALEFGVTKGSRAAANLARILLGSEELMLKLRYIGSYARQHLGWMPDRVWIRDDVIGGVWASTDEHELAWHRDRYGFTGKVCIPGILAPMFNSETLEADCTEKLEALALARHALELYDAVIADLPDLQQAEEVRATLVYQLHLAETIAHYVCAAFRFLNSDCERALKHITAWRKAWAAFNHAAEQPGAPTPMLDAGMVASVDHMHNHLNSPEIAGTMTDKRSPV